jgi:hypothetical protein
MADVTPAIAWSLFTALLCALVGGMACIVLGWRWEIILGAGTLGAVGAWSVSSIDFLNPQTLIVSHQEIVREPVEPVLIEGPGRSLKVQVDEGNRHTMGDLPDTPEFRDFARRVSRENTPASFCETTAAEAGLPIDVKHWRHPSEMGFRQVRDLFIDRGWAYWINPKHHQSGVGLKRAGRQTLRRAAQPLPQQDDVPKHVHPFARTHAHARVGEG